MCINTLHCSDRGTEDLYVSLYANYKAMEGKEQAIKFSRSYQKWVACDLAKLLPLGTFSSNRAGQFSWGRRGVAASPKSHDAAASAAAKHTP